MGSCMSITKLRKILVVGYEKSGKSTLLLKLTGMKPEKQENLPYSIVSFDGYEFYELQGDIHSRVRWVHQMSAGIALIYVIEAEFFKEQVIDLEHLLQLENVKQMSIFLAITNGKEDQADNLIIEELKQEYNLESGHFNLNRGDYPHLKRWIKLFS